MHLVILLFIILGFIIFNNIKNNDTENNKYILIIGFVLLVFYLCNDMLYKDKLENNCILGLGPDCGGKATAVTNNTTNITRINNNTLNQMNKQISDVTANAMINNSSKAIITTKINQKITFAGCEISGNVDINGSSQSTKAYVDFSAVEVSKVENEMAQEMLTSLVSEISSKFKTKDLAKMDAKAEASLEDSGWLPSGGGSTSSKTNNTYNLKSVNNNHRNISNLVEDIINTNFEVNSSQECIDEMKVNQELDFAGCKVGGSVEINNFTQEASVKNIAECILKQGTVQSIVNKSINEMGVKVSDETIAETEVEQTAESFSKTVNKGIGSSASMASSGMITSCMLAAILLPALIWGLTSDENQGKAIDTGTNIAKLAAV